MLTPVEYDAVTLRLEEIEDYATMVRAIGEGLMGVHPEDARALERLSDSIRGASGALRQLASEGSQAQ